MVGLYIMFSAGFKVTGARAPPERIVIAALTDTLHQLGLSTLLQSSTRGPALKEGKHRSIYIRINTQPYIQT